MTISAVRDPLIVGKARPSSGNSPPDCIPRADKSDARDLSHAPLPGRSEIASPAEVVFQLVKPLL